VRGGRAPLGIAEIDDLARERVDDQRDDEEQQPGGEQRRAVDRGRRGLAELVGDHRRQRVALVEDLLADGGRVADHQDHRDGLAQGAPEAQHGGARDAGPRVREDGRTDHLPARRAERKRGLLVVGRHRGDDLAGDGRDDGQDHDREDQPCDEVARAGDVAAHPGQEREGVGGPLHRGAQLGDEEEHAPQAVDHRGHRGEQLDENRHRRPQPPGAELDDEDRHGDCDGHPDDQRDDRGDDRPEDEGEGAEVLRTRVPVVAEDVAEDPLLVEHRRRLARQLPEEVDE
jgi:hypothetical protein